MNQHAKTLLCMVCLTVLLPLRFAQASADEGDPAPEFHAMLADGPHFMFTGANNKVLILHFWASWCEACLTEMPALESFYQKHKGEGLQVVAVSMDETKNETKARQMMKKYSFPWAFGKDANFKKYGRIWRLPLTFVIDRKGILKKDGWAGDKALELSDFESFVTPLLKAK